MAMPMTGSSKPSATSTPREAAFRRAGIETDDRIGERLDRRTARAVAIGVALADVDAALFVQGHRDRVDDERIGGHQLDLETLRHDEVLVLLLGGEAGRDLAIRGGRSAPTQPLPEGRSRGPGSFSWEILDPLSGSGEPLARTRGGFILTSKLKPNPVVVNWSEAGCPRGNCGLIRFPWDK